MARVKSFAETFLSLAAVCVAAVACAQGPSQADTESTAQASRMSVADLDHIYGAAIDAMNNSGNRIGNGIAGNLLRNTGINKKLWKCEDQSPYVASRFRKALDARRDSSPVCLVVAAADGTHGPDWHTYVVVGMSSRLVADGIWQKPTGGTLQFYDPWEGKKVGTRPHYAVGHYDCEPGNWAVETLGREVP